MKKILAIIISCCLLFISCANSKTFTIDDKHVTVQPYGWMNKSEKNENVNYKICTGNIVWSVILSETIIAPILLTGLGLYEPESVK